MSYTKTFTFINPTHPWETLSELLEEKLMSQKELSERLWVTEKHISGIITWKNNISPDLALKLESIFKISASFWNNLQTSYNEDISRIQEQENLNNEKSLVVPYWYKFLKNLWFVEDTKDTLQKVKSMRMFFWVASLFSIPILSSNAFAFRKTEKIEFKHELFASWLRVWEKIADTIEVEDFSKSKLKNILKNLKELSKEEIIDVKKIENILKEAWVRFVFVENFAWNPVMWVTKKYKWNPLIQIWDRGKKMDIFWFTLFHEIGHLLEHYSSEKNTFIDYENPESNELETAADQFARNFLVDENIYNEEIKKPIIDIEKIAKQSETSTSIVAWRVCHDLWKTQQDIWKQVWHIRKSIQLVNLQYKK